MANAWIGPDPKRRYEIDTAHRVGVGWRSSGRPLLDTADDILNVAVQQSWRRTNGHFANLMGARQGPRRDTDATRNHNPLQTSDKKDEQRIVYLHINTPSGAREHQQYLMVTSVCFALHKQRNPDSTRPLR